MTNKELLEVISSSELDLHQQFTLSNFKKSIDNHKNIDELKDLLTESMKQLMTKDNIIKALMKQIANNG